MHILKAESTASVGLVEMSERGMKGPLQRARKGGSAQKVVQGICMGFTGLPQERWKKGSIRREAKQGKNRDTLERYTGISGRFARSAYVSCSTQPSAEYDPFLKKRAFTDNFSVCCLTPSVFCLKYRKIALRNLPSVRKNGSSRASPQKPKSSLNSAVH